MRRPTSTSVPRPHRTGGSPWITPTRSRRSSARRPTGIDDAIQNGIGRAAKTLRNLDWFEVTDIRGAMNDGAIAWYQVTMKVGFRLDDGD